MDIYYDSIQFELEKYWTLEYNLLKNSTWEFEGEDCLVLTLEDGFLSRTYAETLKNYFKQIFLNRFGYEIDVIYNYAKKKGSHYEKENEHKLSLRVAEIEKNMHAASEGDGINDNISDNKKETKKKSNADDAKAAAEKKTAAAASFKGNNSGNDYYKKKPNNNDVLYGRDFDEEPIPIEQVDSAIGEVVIAGMVRKVEEREIRNERTIVMFDITDFTDTISVKLFIRNEQLPEIREFIKKKNFLKIKGIAALDKYDQEISISNVWGIRKSSDTREVRNDLALNKRVELHCHTKMSDMDGVSKVGDIIKQAVRWGHKGIAITDHGVVQAFTDAYHVIQDMQSSYKKQGRKFDFKVIYGVEAYLVDDTKTIVVNSKGQNLDTEFVVFDLETTGFSAEVDKIIEIGACKNQGRSYRRYIQQICKSADSYTFQNRKSYRNKR